MTILTQSQSVRGTTRNFLNVDETIDKCRDIAAAHVWVPRAETALTVAAHGVDVAAVTLHKHCMLLAAAHICHYDVEATYFRQVVDNFVTANSQLSIIIIYRYIIVSFQVLIYLKSSKWPKLTKWPLESKWFLATLYMRYLLPQM